MKKIELAAKQLRDSGFNISIWKGCRIYFDEKTYCQAKDISIYYDYEDKQYPEAEVHDDGKSWVGIDCTLKASSSVKREYYKSRMGALRQNKFDVLELLSGKFPHITCPQHPNDLNANS